MKTTILLICADRAADLEHSLPAAMAQDDAEVVVIDNASEDATPEVVARHGAHHLRLPARVSWAEANNAGIDGTTGPAVLLLNADCFLEPDFLAGARARGSRSPRVGSVTPKLIAHPRDRARGAPGRRSTASGWSSTGRRKNDLAGHGDRRRSPTTLPGAAFGPDGAAALYRREMLDDCRLGRRGTRRRRWRSGPPTSTWRGARGVLGWSSVYEPGAVATMSVPTAPPPGLACQSATAACSSAIAI